MGHVDGVGVVNGWIALYYAVLGLDDGFIERSLGDWGQAACSNR